MRVVDRVAGLPGPAHAIAFGRLLTLGLGAVALGVLATPVLRRRARPVGLTAAAGAAAQGVALARRARPLPGHGADAPAAGPDAADLVVLVFNTLAVVPGEDLAGLVLAHGAHVAVLPETPGATAAAAADALAAAGRPVQHAAADGTDGGPTAVLLDASLGPFEITPLTGTRMGGLVARATRPDAPLPVLHAVHPESPGAPAQMAGWRREGPHVLAPALAEAGSVLAGDLNATLDHPGLAGLRGPQPGPGLDAARAVGRADAGTWPAGMPSALSTPIDHVVVDGRAWAVVEHRVLPATGGSDHRPVLVRLRRRASAAAAGSA